MKHLLIIFCTVLLPLSASSTPTNFNEGSISGTIMDKDFEEPIPYATISVHDSTGNLISGTVSTAEGDFNLNNLANGTYTLKVQFMGFTPASRDFAITSTQKHVDLGIVYMDPSISELDDVTVVAESSTIEQRIDRKVVNVGKDLTATGPSAADIMNNIPSVSVDMDGNLSLRGNRMYGFW